MAPHKNPGLCFCVQCGPIPIRLYTLNLEPQFTVHSHCFRSNPWLQQDVKHATEVHQLMEPVEIKGSKQRQVEDDRIMIHGCMPCSKETKDTLAEMLDFSLLKDPIFIIFTLSNFCTSVGFNIPYVYIAVSIHCSM
jgi:hypothetical protein